MLRDRVNVACLLWGSILGLSALLSSVGEAQAHLVTTGLGPLYDGAAHFAATPEDLLPVAGLAVLAGLRGPAHGRWILFVLPLLWLAGAFAGQALPASVGEGLAAASFLMVGGLVATDAPLPVWGSAGIAALVGVALGYSDGSTLPTYGSGVLILLGIVATVFAVFALIVALVLPQRSRLARLAMRVSGSWIAAVGLLLLGWSLRSPNG
jgi:urease accessory protein